MSRLLSSGEIVKVLEKHKFLFVSQKGSHGKWKNNHGRTVIVPMNKKEIPYGTFNSIVKQSGLVMDVFLKSR